MEQQLIIAGFGGQGVLLMGQLLAYSGMLEGNEVSWMPAYGPEKRGGTANSTVKFGEFEGERVGTPIMHKADAAIIMNEPSLKFLRYCKKGATVLVNANTVDESVVIPDDYKVIRINCDQLAHETKNAKGTSIVMLGALTKACCFYDRQHMIDSMAKMFAEKGKSKFDALNNAAFDAGYNAVN